MFSALFYFSEMNIIEVVASQNVETQGYTSPEGWQKTLQEAFQTLEDNDYYYDSFVFIQASLGYVSSVLERAVDQTTNRNVYGGTASPEAMKAFKESLIYWTSLGRNHCYRLLGNDFG